MAPYTTTDCPDPVNLRPLLYPAPLLAALAPWPLLPVAQAASLPANWGYCHIQPLLPDETVAPAADNLTHLSSDRAEAQDNQVYTLEGNVLLLRNSAQINAEHAVYDEATGEVHAEGGVRFTQEGLTLEGTRAQFSLDQDRGRMSDAEYRLVERHARGTAAEVRRKDKDVTVLRRATYTTCEPGDEDWLLKAQRVRLDQASGMGSAANASLSFMGVPFLYLPYISFPITGARKTGLLLPSFGRSETSGLEFSWPLYLNLAPSRDATLTPRIIERRGTQLGAEFRYLTDNSHGAIYGEYLPGDELYGEKNRRLVSYRHNTRLPAGWGVDLLANNVSDPNYFEDLGNSLTAVSTSYLENRIDLTHQGVSGNFTARVQGYQIVDETLPSASRPYERLPQLLYTLRRDTAWGADYGLDGEYVRFARDQSVTGTRLDLRPTVSMTRLGGAYAITPALALRHTRYMLDSAAAGMATETERTLPVLSLDGTVFFERGLPLAGRTWRQTLEPRLYYLYVPYKDQSGLPVFDSSALDFSYAQLFRDNRYSGTDRVGDANQISLAVTSRVLAQDTGAERLRAGIGQIYYFRDRRVVLPGEAAQTRATSDIIAEVQGQVDTRWRATAQWQWNPDAERTDVLGVQVRYRRGPREVLNLGHRFRNNQLDQSDVSFLWPLGQQWHAVGRWNYSYREQRPVETLAGLEYESCCWAWRFVSRRYVNDGAGAINQAWYFQLELKGLSSLGNGIEQLLEHGILGYP